MSIAIMSQSMAIICVPGVSISISISISIRSGLSVPFLLSRVHIQVHSIHRDGSVYSHNVSVHGHNMCTRGQHQHQRQHQHQEWAQHPSSSFPRARIHSIHKDGIHSSHVHSHNASVHGHNNCTRGQHQHQHQGWAQPPSSSFPRAHVYSIHKDGSNVHSHNVSVHGHNNC